MTLKTLLGSSTALPGASIAGFHPMLRGPMVAFAPDTEALTGPGAFEDAVASLAALSDEDGGDAGESLLDDNDPSDEDDGAETGDATEPEDEDEASDQEAGDDDAPDEDDPASEDDAEDDGDEPTESAIEAPKFWSAEEKALFAKAPPELQTLIAAKDKAAEQRVYEAKEEAATERKNASAITAFKEIIDQQVSRAEELFKGKWDEVDFAKWAKDINDYASSDDPDPTKLSQAQAAFHATKAEFEAEQKALADLQRTQEATAAAEHKTFLREQGAKLRDPETGVPELVDPEKGKENMAAVRSMLLTEGYTPDELKWLGASELKIAWKAVQFDRIKARAAAKPTPKPEPVKEKKAASVKPAAAPAPRKAASARKRQELFGRAYKTGRMDDAVAAVMALE